MFHAIQLRCTPRALAWTCFASLVIAATSPLSDWVALPAALLAWREAASPAPAPASPSSALRFLPVWLLILAVGSSFSFYGVFTGPGVSPPAGLALLYTVSVFTWACAAPAFALHASVSAELSSSHVALLSFPLAFTFLLWGLSRLGPFGDFGSPAGAQLPLLPIAQLASLAGADGIVFAQAHVASVLAAAVAPWGASGVGTGKALSRHHAAVVAAFAVSALAWGCARANNGAAVELDHVLRPHGPVGGASRPLESLWADVRARVAAGDHIVMTSEVAVATSNQTSLLETVAAIAAGGDSYVGIGFDARVDGGGDAQAPEDAVVEGRRANSFALFRPRGGGLAFTTVKAHPVPYVEAGYARGSGGMPFEPAGGGFGTISAAICFDVDFPAGIAQAGRRRASMLLQPAETWGGARFRLRHVRGDSLRALENGLTLVRCAADGVSGGVGPRGETWGTWAATGSVGTYAFRVPWPAATRVDTLAARTGGGDAVGAACGLGAAAVAAAVVVERARKRRGGGASRAPPAIDQDASGGGGDGPTEPLLAPSADGNADGA